jgi:hypothetical protein
MKYIALLYVLGLAGRLAVAAQAADVEQVKKDLIGHTMGGREKSWKFQSTDQIKELVIASETEDEQKRVLIVSLKLQAGQANAQFHAQARVEYAKSRQGWKVKHIGLLSLAKIS